MVPFSAPHDALFSVPLEKSSVHFGRNTKNSDLATSISSNFSKADAQDLIASGRVVPEGDLRDGIKIGAYEPKPISAVELKE
jgi:hypothetical protein